MTNIPSRCYVSRIIPPKKIFLDDLLPQAYIEVQSKLYKKRNLQNIHGKKEFCGGDGYFGIKKLAEKVRKSRKKNWPKIA